MARRVEGSRYAEIARIQRSLRPALGAADAPAPPPLEIEDVQGRAVAYQRRRFLPQGRLMPVWREVVVREGDRLDLLAYRNLGSPEQYWRIADANDAMDPEELLAEPGHRLRIPLPEADLPATAEEEEAP